jgi:tRNA-splicing ligase RtcB
MNEPNLATFHTWLVEPMPRDVSGSIQKLRRQADVAHIAVMPDVHLAQDVCVGVVMATRQLIYPSAVGGDIGCGMATVAVNAEANVLDSELLAMRVLDGLRDVVPTNKHHQPRALPDRLPTSALSDPVLARHAQRDGRVQLGTLGRGNHFLEFQADTENRLWIMVHSGSRAMGQWITKHHMGGSRTANRLLSLDSLDDRGRSYLMDAAWARVYAEENRRVMLSAVETLLRREFAWSLDWDTLIHADHNHVLWELHDQEGYWVHRKGAQSVSKDVAGLVPGSMGTASFHVAGRGHAPAFDSCSHGAGRRLPRGSATRSLSARDFTRDMSGVWFDPRKASRLLDEAPSAYKDIRAVMRAQRDLIRITREVRPILSYKGV